MTVTSSFIRAYAKAIFILALEKKQLQEWSEALAFMAEVVKDKDLTAVENNPNISDEKFFLLLKNICSAKISDEKIELLKILVFKHKVSCIPAIYGQYENLRAHHEGILTILVKSARALTNEQKRRLHDALARLFASQVNMEYQLNTGLIGGVMLQIGDRVIDGSIRGIWQKLAAQLNTSL